MPQDVIVRAPTREDFDAWSRLWAGYNAFYERKGPTAVPPEMTQLTWDRFFDAYQGGKLVGLVHYLYHRNTVMRGPTCYLQDLFTDADLRGQGVGRALIETVYDRARAAGSPRVYWQTHETNTTAMKLYDKVATKSGFVVYRTDL